MSRLTKEDINKKVIEDRLLTTMILSGEISEEEYKNRMFNLHSNLPQYVINKILPNLSRTSDYFKDLSQAGFVGMIIAFNKFKRENNNIFFVYAENWVRKYVYEEIQLSHLIKTPKDEYINCFYIEDSTLDDLVYEEDHSNDNTVDILDDELRTWFRENELKVNIFVDFSFKQESMRKIGLKYDIPHQFVSEVIRGKRLKGVLVREPFINSARRDLEKFTKGYDVNDFIEHYISKK